MAGVGFDAEAVYMVNRRLKKYSGKGGYFASGLKVLAGWKPETLPVLVDGRQYRATSLIVCNGAKYGGHVKAAPDANLFEPGLYAILMTGSKRRDILRYALGILTGGHTKLGDVKYLRCMKVEINGTARIQADGDYIGTAPVAILAAGERLKLVCP
ncbi:MAG: hypothetical protein M0Z59_04105, partial [Nitrospiraceae bacterium]|nr:hypothetical protein [Nitrospiraceae bacterium]